MRKSLILIVCVMMLVCSTTAYAGSYDHFTPLPEDEGVITFGNPTDKNHTAGPGANSSATGGKTNSGSANSTAASNDFNYTLEEFAEEMLYYTNQLREEHGLAPLRTDPVLTQMAQARIDENNGVLTHTRPDGSDPGTIFSEYDTDLKPAGENLSSAGRTPQAMVQGLYDSEGHRQNLLNADAEYVGIGVVWVDTVMGPRISALQLFAK